ncbi:unnamed protein product [Rhizophagus irregularis]|nr:unnamed protein product [Rhizophagus irregularis]
MRLPPGHTAQHSDYLSIARKYHFIFLKSQYVKNAIRHLSYKKAFTILNADDYPFLVPYYAKNPPQEYKIRKNVKTLTKHLKQSDLPSSSIDPIHLIEGFNLILDMFIPEKYSNIIPKDPIYVNDSFVVPGSREWFTYYMYNLEKSITEQKESDSYEKARREWDRLAKEGCELAAAESQQRHAIERAQVKEKLDAKTKEALYHGTSLKHYPARSKRIKSLTHSTDKFHNYIPNYLEKRESLRQKNQSRKCLNITLAKFLRTNNIRYQGNLFDKIHTPIIVSDDTEAIEHHPNKWDSNHNKNHYFSYKTFKFQILNSLFFIYIF